MRRVVFCLLLCLLPASVLRGQGHDLFEPMKLSMLPDDESIYAPPQPKRADEGVNAGGVNIDLAVRVMTDYVYRGVDHSEAGGAEDTPNHQFDGKLTFDFGKAPHPFIGLFANVYNSDPISRFQEIRPTIGLDWTIKPLTLTGGVTTYILPEREEFNTAEVFGKIQFDDSVVFLTDKPIFTPYIMGAYDYDQNKGWYVEMGAKHDHVIEDTGITVSLYADVAYIVAFQQLSLPGNRDTGWQHYDIGMTATYNLNTLINLPKRYGEISIQGYLTYTDGIANALKADTQLWGGAGVVFHY